MSRGENLPSPIINRLRSPGMTMALRRLASAVVATASAEDEVSELKEVFALFWVPAVLNIVQELLST